MSTQLGRIVKKANSNPKLRFTSLAHLLTPELLTETWRQMNRRGASGVDGETIKEFVQDLDTRVQELCERLKRGTEFLRRTGATSNRPGRLHACARLAAD